MKISSLTSGVILIVVSVAIAFADDSNMQGVATDSAAPDNPVSNSATETAAQPAENPTPPGKATVDIPVDKDKTIPAAAATESSPAMQATPVPPDDSATKSSGTEMRTKIRAYRNAGRPLPKGP